MELVRWRLTSRHQWTKWHLVSPRRAGTLCGRLLPYGVDMTTSVADATPVTCGNCQRTQVAKTRAAVAEFEQALAQRRWGAPA